MVAIATEVACPVCNGNGWVTADEETRAVARCPECSLVAADAWIGANLPERLRGIPAKPSVRGSLEAVLRSGWPKPGLPWAIVLWGPAGTGKSYEGTWLWRELVRRSSRPSAWLNLHHELEEARRGVNGPEEKAFVDRAMRSGVVFFDDLTTETLGSIRERLVIEALSVRYDRMLPTIITTNLTGEDFAKWDGRLASRLRAGITLHYGGDDRRADAAKEWRTK